MTGGSVFVQGMRGRKKGRREGERVEHCSGGNGGGGSGILQVFHPPLNVYLRRRTMRDMVNSSWG